MKTIRAWFATRAGRIVLHDGAVAVGVGVAYLETTHQPIDRAALLAAGTIAVRAFLRLILPVPVSGRMNNIPPDVTRDHLALLPPPSGRKHGAVPSPPDERDHPAKLPRLSAIPASVNYGLGLVFRMLLNNVLGCCYPAALLHALQVLSGGTFTPTDADALHVYEAMGYDPTRTDANGNNRTDRGTVGRVLFAWALKQGLITSYAAVPTDRASIKAAIAAHKAVLCEWALPVGAEREGVKWTMPRSNKAAGSWGYHATVEVGYTSRHNDNVTWGEEGTVTPPFEDAYLQAAWVVEAPAVIPPIR